MGRAQGGRACWDGQPSVQIVIVRGDICVDHLLTGCGHPVGDESAAGTGLRLADEKLIGFEHWFHNPFGPSDGTN